VPALVAGAVGVLAGAALALAAGSLLGWPGGAKAATDGDELTDTPRGRAASCRRHAAA